MAYLIRGDEQGLRMQKLSVEVLQFGWKRKKYHKRCMSRGGGRLRDVTMKNLVQQR
jgi:hypothetical protein